MHICWKSDESRILNIDTKLRPNSDKTYVKLNEVIIRPSCNHEGMIPNSDQSYVKRKEVIIRINQKFPNFQLFIIIWENSEILNIDTKLRLNSDKTYVKLNEVIIRPSCNHEGRNASKLYLFANNSKYIMLQNILYIMK